MTAVRKGGRKRQAERRAHAKSEAASEGSVRWVELERAVANVERVLDTGAKVFWNVQRQAAYGKRQFDVVVCSGAPGREFTTVFEVQKRGRKVQLADFDSWVSKARSAKAERLICVSAMGFVRAVQHAAANDMAHLHYFRAADEPPTPKPTGLSFIEVLGFVGATDPDALHIRAGDPCLHLETDPSRTFSIEDLIWRQNAENGWGLETGTCSPGENIIFELTRFGRPRIFFAHGSEVRNLTVLFRTLPIAETDCVIRDAAYRRLDSEQPALWATHAKVTAYDLEGEVTLATVQDARNEFSIVQRVCTPTDGELVIRDVPDRRGPDGFCVRAPAPGSAPAPWRPANAYDRLLPPSAAITP